MKKKGIVLYRNAFEKHFHFVSGECHTFHDFTFLKSKSGFVFAPFDQRNHPAIFISPETFTPNFDLENLDKDAIALPKTKSLSKDQNVDYRSLVKEASQRIQKGEFQKLVLSRKRTLKLAKDFNPIRFLRNLDQAFPECLVSMVLIPDELCWIGASPEILAKKDEKGVFETVALAGTKEKLANTPWGQKEMEEQAMVSDFIIEILQDLGIAKMEVKGPFDSLTGNLIHLKTEISCHLDSETENQFINIVERLHPTPAVSGLEQKSAIDFISQNEGYSREYYSGFLGPLNIESKTSLFVNLRCMQLFKEEAILYAGAGITKDSDPESEFQETEKKLNALKQYLNATADTL